MPVLDGLEVLKAIRAQNIPVEAIMVTAANDRASLEDALHFGAVDYLVKPFAFDRFQLALEKFRAQKAASTTRPAAAPASCIGFGSHRR